MLLLAELGEAAGGRQSLKGSDLLYQQAVTKREEEEQVALLPYHPPTPLVQVTYCKGCCLTPNNNKTPCLVPIRDGETCRSPGVAGLQLILPLAMLAEADGKWESNSLQKALASLIPALGHSALLYQIRLSGPTIGPPSPVA